YNAFTGNSTTPTCTSPPMACAGYLAHPLEKLVVFLRTDVPSSQHNPRKTSTASLPEALKLEVTTRANELIETVLKLKYIQPTPPLPLQSSTRWGVGMLPG